MRTAFVRTLCELAAADERIMLLTADLGWSVVEPFAVAFPNRFLNVGVAEQNMLGIAAGLALEGKVPFVYSIATFASMRGYEQFRNGAVLHRLPVRVVGIGGGFAYGHAGPTHHALEDLSIARTQPGVSVLAPADRAQARQVLRATAHLPGPAYLRIDKNDAPDLPGLDGRFELDTPELLRLGRDLLFLATGSITREALRAAAALESNGVSAAVAVLAHLSYQPGAALAQLLGHYPVVMTVEEGSTAGGLGSLTAEAIAENGLRCRLSIQGARELHIGATGGVEFMRRQHGLDAASLAERARALVHERPAAWRLAA
jgi:transketolase